MKLFNFHNNKELRRSRSERQCKFFLVKVHKRVFALFLCCLIVGISFFSSFYNAEVIAYADTVGYHYEDYTYIQNGKIYYNSAYNALTYSKKTLVNIDLLANWPSDKLLDDKEYIQSDYPILYKLASPGFKLLGIGLLVPKIPSAFLNLIGGHYHGSGGGSFISSDSTGNPVYDTDTSDVIDYWRNNYSDEFLAENCVYKIDDYNYISFGADSVVYNPNYSYDLSVIQDSYRFFNKISASNSHDNWNRLNVVYGTKSDSNYSAEIPFIYQTIYFPSPANRDAVSGYIRVYKYYSFSLSGVTDDSIEPLTTKFNYEPLSIKRYASSTNDAIWCQGYGNAYYSFYNGSGSLGYKDGKQIGDFHLPATDGSICRKQYFSANWFTSCVYVSRYARIWDDVRGRWITLEDAIEQNSSVSLSPEMATPKDSPMTYDGSKIKKDTSVISPLSGSSSGSGDSGSGSGSGNGSGSGYSGTDPVHTVTSGEDFEYDYSGYFDDIIYWLKKIYYKLSDGLLSISNSLNSLNNSLLDFYSLIDEQNGYLKEFIVDFMNFSGEIKTRLDNIIALLQSSGSGNNLPDIDLTPDFEESPFAKWIKWGAEQAVMLISAILDKPIDYSETLEGIYEEINDLYLQLSDIKNILNNTYYNFINWNNWRDSFSNALFESLNDINNLLEDIATGDSGSGTGNGNDFEYDYTSTLYDISDYTKRIRDNIAYLATLFDEFYNYFRTKFQDFLYEVIVGHGSGETVVVLPSNDDTGGIWDFINTLLSMAVELQDQLQTKFPFSIPWELLAIFGLFAAEPKVPDFDLNLKLDRFNIDEKIHVDMLDFEKIGQISRFLLSCLFIVGLMHFTIRYIGKDD